MKHPRFLAVIAVLLLTSAVAFGQGILTGQLTGTVTTDKAPLPGATITISSPNLQGVRTAVSDSNGNYNFAALPPGPYTVKVELAGMQPINRTVNVTLSGTARVDADLKVAAVSEAITVTASAPAVLETTEVQSNFQKKQIDDLPVGRAVANVALLAPGVTTASVGNGAITISGAMSSDNLIMVNGANVQENLRGQARPLFIEDAIQETTVMSGAISAEFGRFTGGVINTITKSGGNEFSGSLRDTLSNPKWTAVSKAGEPAPNSKLGNTYEGTLGGYVMKDRLWFFTAGRYSKTDNPARFPTLANSNQAVFSSSDNKRYEGKLTGQITPKHSIMVNYLNNPLKSTNDVQLGAWELSGIDPQIEQQEDFRALQRHLQQQPAR
jgi:outer membrane receptor for ferrienterochelin and colicin